MASAAASRPRSRVFRRTSPNALGFHTIQIDCMPNSGCTLFTLFLCSQLSRPGRHVACFPDIFDAQVALPERINETSTAGVRDHHYVGKMKMAHLWASADGSDSPHPPCEFDGETLTWRSWERVRPTARILFVRDPLQNYLSLRIKRFCEAGGGMRAKFLLADHLFARELRAERPYYDAVLHAEDMADAPALVRTLGELLGTPAVGLAPRPMGSIAVWLDGAHRVLARSNQALGYHWGGDVRHPTAKRPDARHGKGNPVRYGTGNAYIDRANRTDVPFYQPRLKSYTPNEAALVSSLAPRLAAAYRPSWHRPSATPRKQVKGNGLVSRVCDGCLWRKGCNHDQVGPKVQLYGLRSICACPTDGHGWATELRAYDPRIKEKLKPALFRCRPHEEVPSSTGARLSLHPSLRCALAPLPAGQGGRAGALPLSAAALARCNAAFAEISARVTAEVG